jgi:hypothetical protein
MANNRQHSSKREAPIQHKATHSNQVHSGAPSASKRWQRLSTSHRGISKSAIALASAVCVFATIGVTNNSVYAAKKQAKKKTPTTTAVPKSAITKPVPKPIPLEVDSGTVRFEDERTSYKLELKRNDWIRLDSDRSFSLRGPFSTNQTFTGDGIFRVPITGTYFLEFNSSDVTTGSLTVTTSRPPTTSAGAIGNEIAVELTGDRPEAVTYDIKGGQRYELSTSSDNGTFCILQHNTDGPPAGRPIESDDINPLRQIQQQPRQAQSSRRKLSFTEPSISGDCFSAGTKRTVIAHADERLTIVLQGTSFDRIASVKVKLREIANDRVLDLDGNSSARARSQPDARTIIPLWGSVGERAVVGSPLGGRLRTYGEPWIEREETATTYLIPFQFRFDIPPYLAWGGSTKPEDYDAFIFKGDDGVFPLTVGAPATVATNKAWLRAVVPFTLVQGHRYQIDLNGENLRNAGFAIRAPSGRRTTSAGNWNYDDPNDTGDFTHVSTVVEARHGGNWVLEMDPRSANVVSMQVKVVDIGGRVAYEPVTNVKALLHPGEAVDVDLLPGEWAQVNFATGKQAELVAPLVQRYRNTTFDGTAADITVWDGDGRLLYSNNKDLQEEVFTGRLGSETKAAENFVLLRPNATYRMVVDPQGDLAGRFRLSVSSQQAVKMMPVDLSKGPQTIVGWQAGILEVRDKPMGIAVKGSLCIATSNLELSGGDRRDNRAPQIDNLTAIRTQQGGFCVGEEGVTLPPGVHTLIAAPNGNPSATISAAPAGIGSPVIADKTITLEEQTFFAAGEYRVKVSLEATKLYPLDQNDTTMLRAFDPSGFPIKLGGASLQPQTTGMYTFYLRAFPKPSDKASITIGNGVEPVHYETYEKLGEKQEFNLVEDQLFVFRVHKPANGTINIRTNQSSTVFKNPNETAYWEEKPEQDLLIAMEGSGPAEILITFDPTPPRRK